MQLKLNLAANRIIMEKYSDIQVAPLIKHNVHWHICWSREELKGPCPTAIRNILFQYPYLPKQTEFTNTNTPHLAPNTV